MVVVIVGIPVQRIAENRSVRYVKVRTAYIGSAETNDNRCMQTDRTPLYIGIRRHCKHDSACTLINQDAGVLGIDRGDIVSLVTLQAALDRSS
ncbi:hypothetical protein [Mycobacterium lepromatosis]|uniref:hypothetical protein n=1 Tax=Mycobacterium lepromatosis TaxID=480418 RepID=UPI0005F7770D|nr:hypothetical protein [Mycobacterium lepromatosis]